MLGLFHKFLDTSSRFRGPLAMGATDLLTPPWLAGRLPLKKSRSLFPSQKFFFSSDFEHSLLSLQNPSF